MMRNNKYNLLIMLGLILGIGFSAVDAGAQSRPKRPKNTGILTVKTSPVAYSVNVDGQFVGMSGVDTPAEFYLTPGFHRMEVEFPDGKFFTKDIEIVRDRKNCVCLSFVERSVTRLCPYDIQLEGPQQVSEGDLITFVSRDVRNSPTPVNYTWRVSPANARITSGLGTSSITVDTSGLGGQTVTAELDVNDGSVYDAKCRQNISVPTFVERLPPPEPPKSFRFDRFIALSFDDDKARLDAFAIELQNNPDAQGYIILYQGSDRNSMRNKKVETLSKRALDYLVKTRGIDPRRIAVTQGGITDQTMYDLWIVPPGATPPVPGL